MKLAALIVSAAIVATSFATPALADDAETATELRCILLAGRMTSAKQPEGRQAGMNMAFYFVGRLDKKFSAAELEKRLIDEAKTVTPEKFKAASTTCIDQIQSRAAFLENLGGKLNPPEPGAKAGPKQ